MKAGLFLVALVSAITYCSAIRCYECTVTAVGAGDPKCDDPFYELEPPYVKDCDIDVYEKCRKTKMYLANGRVSIVRACAEKKYCVANGCKMYGGQTVCEHCCYGDTCNGARVSTFDTVLLFTAAGLAFLY